MWRTAASLELLPTGTKTELGEALLRRVKAGDFRESELWCLSRLGARELFYGPINQVLPPAVAGRWAEALLPWICLVPPMPWQPSRAAPKTLPGIWRPLRSRGCGVASKACRMPERYLAMLEGGEERDERTLGRIFGEELPSGLVLAGDPPLPGSSASGARDQDADRH